MPIALVASVGTGAATTSPSGGTSAAIDTTGATLLAVWTASYGGGTISDSKGNTWTGLPVYGVSPSQGAWYYCLAPTVGAGHTFTYTGSGHVPVWIAYAFSGVGSFQNQAGAQAFAGPPPLSTFAITPSADGALILTGLAALQSDTTLSVTPGPFTLQQFPYLAGVQVKAGAAYQIQPTAAAIGPAWSWTPDTIGYIGAGTAVFLPTVVSTLPARLSQVPVEVLVLSDAPITLHLSQLPLEVLRSATAELIYARLSQLPLEVLLLSVVSTAEAQLAQLPLEVLSASAPALEGGVTQLVAELAQRQPATLDVTQLPLELAHQQLDSAIDVTQAVVEIARQLRPGPARVTQLLLEIIKRPRPPGVDPLPPIYPTLPIDCGAGGDYPRLPDCAAGDWPVLPASSADVYPPLPAPSTIEFPALPGSECMDASTFVVNMALQEIGISAALESLASDASREAQSARLIYTDVVDTVLRDHPWKFATEYAALVWLAGSIAVPVNPDWAYAFVLPTDCVRVRRVCDPAMGRRYTATPIPFDQRANATGTLDVLLCNEPGSQHLSLTDPPAVTIEYTKRLGCVAQVNDAQFRECLTMKLAARLAKTLARDGAEADRCLRNYLLALPKAQTQHANTAEPQRPTDAPPDWIQGR